MKLPGTPEPLRHSALPAQFLFLLGSAIAVLSLLADRIHGRPESSIGIVQVIGCFAGLGVFASGFLVAALWKTTRAAVTRWSAALCLASGSSVLWLIEPVSAANWILMGYFAAASLLLPPRFGIMTFGGLVALHVLLTWISRIKVDLTGMPLTMLDIRIATGNPAGLWDALSLPHWSRHLAIASVCVVLLLWVSLGLLAAGRFIRRTAGGATTGESWGRILMVGSVAVTVWIALHALYPAMARDSGTWHPERIARLADRTGILPFLAYSYHIESEASGDIYRDDGSSLAPNAEEVQQSLLQYIQFSPRRNAISPNVVVVLAESTFDPARTFRLQGEWNAYLFTESDLTSAMGPLRVNTKGGGTWIAEFETVTGLDSRLFGYSGAYTHASLSPFVERSLATWMEKRGYRTWAFLANRGNFYNSRRAYEGYGFQHVWDSEDLGSESDWFDTDREVASSVIAALGPEPVTPFFAYVVTIENHSPHDCDITESGRLQARFVDSDAFTPNCALHEYLRRLDSTTAAVQSLLRYLADLEARTGRPFVLVAFGDHQPSTFTGSGEYKYIADYSAFRIHGDMYTTFFHVLSSTGVRLDCCSLPLPIAALPTLVSGFVASGPDDVYLGENLWLYSQCGSDAIGRSFGDNMVSLTERTSDEPTEACDAAYRRALAAYRNAGIVRLTGKRKRRE